MYSRLYGWKSIHACVGNTPHSFSLADALIYYDIPKTAAALAAVIYSDLVSLFNQVVLLRGTWEQKYLQSDDRENINKALKLPEGNERI